MKALCVLPFAFVSVAVCMVCCSGCVVSQEVLLEKADLSGPMNSLPVHITDNTQEGQIRLSPHLAYAKDRELNGLISGGGRELTPRTNIKWKLPEFTFGLGADFVASRSMSVALGWNFGVAGGRGSWNGSLGVAVFKEGEVIGYRFEGGVQVRSMEHDAYVRVITTTDGIFNSSSVDTAYFHDRGSDKALDLYGGLTLNTRLPHWPVNLFLSTILTRQSLLDYFPSTWSELHPFTTVHRSIDDVHISATFVIISPGIYANLDEKTRVLVGVRMPIVIDMDELHPGSTVCPFIQFDLSF